MRRLTTSDRSDTTLVELGGLRKCFLTGGNSTLRQHCRKHYARYKENCEKAGIPLNHHAIPPKVAQAQEKEKKQTSQTTLDNRFVVRPEVFARETSLRAIAQFVACDDQVSVTLNTSGQYSPVDPSCATFDPSSSRRLLSSIMCCSGIASCR